MSEPKRNASGGLIAELPGGYERDYGLGHPFVDDWVSPSGGVPRGFRISPSELTGERLTVERSQPNGSAPRSCAHLLRTGPWGDVCRHCGVLLPERPERKDGEGGRWWACAVGRIWVPE